MSARIRCRHRLQERGREVTLPPQRRLTDTRHVRLQRVTGPSPSCGDGQLTLEIDRMVNCAGFSYDRDGWHPFVAALEQRLAQPELVYRAAVPRALDEAIAVFDRFFANDSRDRAAAMGLP